MRLGGGPPSASPLLVGAGASATPSFCRSVSVSVDYGPYWIAGMLGEGSLFRGSTPAPDSTDAAVGATIVVARVVGSDPAVFNSADGSMPSGFGPGPNWETVFTPVDLDVERVIRGDVVPGRLTILIEGGTAGCYEVRIDVAPKVQIGQRYVLFLYPLQTGATKVHSADLQLTHDAWSIDAQDVVQTVKGPMPLVELIDAIERVTASSGP